MNKFENWLMRLVDQLEAKKKTDDMIYRLVYEFGHDVALEILHAYRRMEKGKDN